MVNLNKLTYLKWLGNKRKLLRLLVDRLPSSFLDYHEPFAGSGALFFYLVRRDISRNASRRNDFMQSHTSPCGWARRYFLCDRESRLINCHKVVASHLDSLLVELERFDARHRSEGKSFFLEQRKLMVPIKNPGDDVQAAARFIYFNRASWRGVLRSNGRGEINTPMSKEQFKGFGGMDLPSCSSHLKIASIWCGDYSSISPRPGDFVFIDPPYYPLSATADFTGYGMESWKDEDHERLFEWLKFLDATGVKFMMTNNDVSFVSKRTD